MSIVTLLRPSQRASAALVRTSSCRGYVVELDPPANGEAASEAPRMITNLFGHVVHFSSLERVRDALRRRGISSATLVQDLAVEETSALGVSAGDEQGVELMEEAGR